MTYRVEFEGAALDTELLAPGDNPARRQAIFGEGYGLLAFDVDDATELIRIYRIAWIG
jgi:hypothetical protein